MPSIAKEYLFEFADSDSQPNWLKALVYDAIETNGEISEERLKDIYNSLAVESELSITAPTLDDGEIENEIFISKLIHKTGVNALEKEQTINFCNDITILYGLNGAGKSSYFKILNEIVGGNQKKIILPNIYAEAPEKINVELTFTEVGKPEESYTWDGNDRSIHLLNRCKVFDSSYLNGLLDTRKTDETLVQPLGLNLFTYLVEILDGFKETFINDANRLRLEKPTIELDNFSDDVKKAFEEHTFSDEIKQKIESQYEFVDELVQKLKSKKEELKTLKQDNINDKIKLENIKKAEISNIKEALKIYHKTLDEQFTSSKTLLNNYSRFKKESKEAKEQFNVLTAIPSSETDEWKEFVKKGATYSDKVEDSEETCVYCRQPLATKESLNIIKAYSLFLKDNSEQQLGETINKIISKKNEIDILTSSLNISESITTFLKKQKNNEEPKSTLYQQILDASKELNHVKTLLSEQLEKREINNELELQPIKDLASILDELITLIQTGINKLKEEDSLKKLSIEKVEKELEILLENEAISNQKDKIIEWFVINKKEANLRGKLSQLKSRKITDCSKIAHTDLLTETLKQNFKEELQGLGYSTLDVKIEGGGGTKGSSSTKLILTKSKDIKAILSEGEQKAVALALFIAETRMQKAHNPIILDDPVTSLDHKIAGRFAERLLCLDNQVIIFNHNRLFLDAFETSKENHICKNFNNGCNSRGKHIKIYRVLNEGKSSKGVLTNYTENKTSVHLSEAKRHLSIQPFNETLKVSVLLRKAVECCIDEVVFNRLRPTKYSNKNESIKWDDLKGINNDESLISELKKIHGRVSGGELHNGTENDENPIDKPEFNDMIASLEAFLN